MTDSRCMIPIAKSPQEYQDYRISPDSSNKLAIAFDPLKVQIRTESIRITPTL
ncbi:MAG TPA: hypothetical protein V6C93_12450 [Allocoleopsis sp.]